MSDSISDITKLTWKTKFSHINKMTALMVEVNNTSFIRSSVSVTRSEVEGGGATAIGRKPYLISKEYVLPGEKYDYLAMMETDFPLGENNTWVAQRKPYESKDYNLMLEGEVEVSTTSQTEYSETDIYSNNPSMVQVVSVINKGETTTAMIVASLAASGSYYVYAKDSFGNVISFKISTQQVVVQRSDSPYPLYVLQDLISGYEIPYTVYTDHNYDALQDCYTMTDIGSIVSSWNNVNGYGTDYYHTYQLTDGTSFISIIYTYSVASTSYLKTEYIASGFVGDTGAAVPYVINQYNKTTVNAGVIATSIVENTLTIYRKYPSASFYYIETYSHWECDISVYYTGQARDFGYRDDDLYVFTTKTYSANGLDQGTSYSGVFEGSPFNVAVAWRGEGVGFAYV